MFRAQGYGKLNYVIIVPRDKTNEFKFRKEREDWINSKEACVCVCGEVRYECVMEELVFTFQQSLIIIGLRRTEDLVSTVVLNCDIKQCLNIV